MTLCRLGTCRSTMPRQPPVYRFHLRDPHLQLASYLAQLLHCSDVLKEDAILSTQNLITPDDHDDNFTYRCSRNKINSVLATIYFISAPSVRTCRAEIK